MGYIRRVCKFVLIFFSFFKSMAYLLLGLFLWADINWTEVLNMNSADIGLQLIKLEISSRIIWLTLVITIMEALGNFLDFCDRAYK